MDGTTTCTPLTLNEGSVASNESTESNGKEYVSRMDATGTETLYAAAIH